MGRTPAPLYLQSSLACRHSGFRQRGSNGGAGPESWPRDDAATWKIWGSDIRRLLAESEMGSIFVIVGNVVREESPQMSLVQCNHVVEQLPPTASNPAVSHPILPGTSNRRLHRCDLHRMDCGGHLKTILCVVVQHDEPVSRLIRKASRSCCTIQLIVGCRVTLKCKMRFRS
jgi:hypothetical protein